MSLTRRLEKLESVISHGEQNDEQREEELRMLAVGITGVPGATLDDLADGEIRALLLTYRESGDIEKTVERLRDERLHPAP